MGGTLTLSGRRIARGARIKSLDYNVLRGIWFQAAAGVSFLKRQRPDRARGPQPNHDARVGWGGPQPPRVVSREGKVMCSDQ